MKLRSQRSTTPGFEHFKKQSHQTTKDDRPVVLLDWDGCLCESTPRIFAKLELIHAGLKRKYPNSYNISNEALKIPWTRELTAHLQLVFGEKYLNEALQLYQECNKNPDLPLKHAFNGAEDFVQSLKRQGVPFAIVTNCQRNILEEAIEMLNWEQLLQDVPTITADMVPNVKPNKAHFYSALETLGLSIADKNREIIVIGDGAESDMLGALMLAAEGHKVSAFWINHGRLADVQLTSVNDFAQARSHIMRQEKAQKAPLDTNHSFWVTLNETVARFVDVLYGYGEDPTIRLAP